MLRTLKMILKRLAWSVFVIFGLSILIFTIARVIPGDPAVMALGPRATEEALETLRLEMHLDEPLIVQYGLWLNDALHGDLGTSTLTKRPVMEDLAEFLPATLELVFFAAILEIIIGTFLGALSARHAGNAFDNTVRVISYVGIATPAFVCAILFMLLFGFVLQVLPVMGRVDANFLPPATVTGFMTIDYLLEGNFAGMWDAFKHLIMPATALSLAGIAQAARITRSSMFENLNKDYVGSEIATGVPMRRVIFLYVLRPSATPTVSIIALDIASMLGNAFLVELIFNYSGLSRYGVDAILGKDLNAVVAVVLVIGLTFAIVNILVDIITAYLDPRIRLQGGGK